MDRIWNSWLEPGGGIDRANAVAVGPDGGNVYVAGFHQSHTQIDFSTAAFSN